MFHIHGEQGEEIIFGHGEFRDNFGNGYWGSEDALVRIHSALKKDTKDIISNSKLFFDGLHNIDRIYSHGFSFSKVDLCYIQEIFKRIHSESISNYSAHS